MMRYMPLAMPGGIYAILANFIRSDSIRGCARCFERGIELYLAFEVPKDCLYWHAEGIEL